MNYSFLIWIVFLPLVGAILIALFGGGKEKLTKYLAAIFTFIPALLAIIAFAVFDRSAGMAGVFQFQEKVSWIPAFGPDTCQRSRHWRGNLD